MIDYVVIIDIVTDLYYGTYIALCIMKLEMCFSYSAVFLN